MNKYKIINLFLAATFAIIAVGINWYVQSGQCIDNCGVELMRSLINPLGVGTPIIAVVFGVLLLFPPDLFRRWLWYCGGPLFVLFVWEVAGVSISGGSIAAPTRVGMAELLAQIYAIVTALFIVGYYIWRWYKTRKTNE